MSLSTRCPACGTAFKVVQEQLVVSDGWVRCGRCSQVFDGNENLVDAAPVAESSTFDFPDFSGLPDISRLDAVPTAPPVDSVAEGDGSGDGDPHSPVPAVPVAAHPTPAVSPDQWPSLDLAPAAVAPPAAGSAHPAADDTFDVARAAILAEPAASEPASDAAKSDHTHGGFSTLERREGPVMRWLRKLPGLDRLPLRTISAGALVLLAAQMVYQSRDAIAASHPSAQPTLAAMCRAAGCAMSALRRIDAIVIDGASFARYPGGEGYRLTFNLRNRAAVPLAMPAVELTLLDAQARPVVRRALMPADFRAPGVLSANATHATLLPLALSLPEATVLPPVAGYSVVTFYP